MKRIKECPFCGGVSFLKHEHWCNDMQFDDDHDLFYVICNSCGASTTKIELINVRYRKTMKEEMKEAANKAITAWNKRAESGNK